MHKYKLENEKSSKTIVDLNAQQEEASKLNGILTNEINDKEAHYERV